MQLSERQIDWLVDGGLIYALEYGVNHYEINVNMVAGSRDTEVRHEFAKRLAAALSQPVQAVIQPKAQDDTQAKYLELIFAVGLKHPNETRHETALRYIQQAERQTSNENAMRQQAGEKA